MSLVPSRRTLAALTVAATLASVFPRSAQALPVRGPRDHTGLVEQALTRITEWSQTLLSVLWGANGSSLDPDGITTSGDRGSSLDPDGATANDDNGSSLDPNGRT
jgi:hypothetical protein